jgi:hypothetical protein
LAPFFFKYSHCNGNKILGPKSIDYDQTTIVLSDY